MDTRSITDTGVGLIDYSAEIRNFVRFWDLQPKVDSPIHELRFSRGPNGPAMTSIVADQRSLTPKQLNALLILNPGGGPERGGKDE